MPSDDAPTRRFCATSEVHRQLLSVDPDYRAARSDIENLTDAVQARGFAAAAAVTRTVQTVVHVVYKDDSQNISNAQIQSQIRILNQDFRMRNRDRTKVPDVFTFQFLVSSPGRPPAAVTTRSRSPALRFTAPTTWA